MFLYNYTDLQFEFALDPDYLCPDEDEMVVVSFRCGGEQTEIKVTSESIDRERGIVKCLVSQSQNGKWVGEVIIQINGFVRGKRWASKKVSVIFKNNEMQEVLNGL